MAYCAYCGSHVAEASYRPCPSCARPTNGAPVAPVGSAAKTSSATIIVVVIVVVLFLIGFAGIVAAIAVPNLLTAMQRSRQKRTMADIRTIGIAVEEFATDKGYFPPGNNIDEVSAAVGRHLPTIDGWAHPIRYECWSSEGETTCTQYAIASAGADKTFEHESLREYTRAETINFDCDIVYEHEGFVQMPGASR